MSKIFARYDIQINSDNDHDQLNIDLTLNSTNKKVIHGTVWDDNSLSPERVPGAQVQLYVAGENYKDDPLDIQPIGYVISDESGEFLAGPFEHGTSVILKIFKIWKYDAYNDNYEYRASSTSCSGETSGECSGETSGECGECPPEINREGSGEIHQYHSSKHKSMEYGSWKMENGRWKLIER